VPALHRSHKRFVVRGDSDARECEPRGAPVAHHPARTFFVPTLANSTQLIVDAVGATTCDRGFRSFVNDDVPSVKNVGRLFASHLR
jgi:hypothetical protein